MKLPEKPRAETMTSRKNGFRLPRAAILGLLMFNAFIIAGGCNVFSPLLVEMARDLNSTVPLVAQLTAFMTLVWAILAPMMGSLADRRGRKPVIMGGLLIMGLGGLSFVFVNSYLAAVAVCLLLGVGGAAANPTLTAVVGDLYPLNERGRAMGKLYTGVILGMALGAPALALVAQQFGWRAAFTVFGACALLGVVIVYILLPHTKPEKREGPTTSLRQSVAQPAVRWYVLVNVFQDATFVLIMTYLPAFAIQNYGLSVGEVAPLVAIVTIGGLLGNLLGGSLADRGWQMPVLYCGPLLAGMLALPLFFFNQSVVVTAALGMAAVFFWGLHRPAYSALAAELCGESRGMMMGINSLSLQAGDTIAPVVGGIALVVSGYSLVGVAAVVLGLMAGVVARWLLCPEVEPLYQAGNSNEVGIVH